MIASITTTTANLIEHHGVLAVFVILAIDAILPVGGELPMVLSGVAAAGVIGNGTAIFGITIAPGLPTYVALGLAGTIGYLAGALAGWAIGRRGGRQLLERHGRWLHLGPARLRKAERWFNRFGPAAVLLGRLTPLVRSFVSVAAGVFEVPMRAYGPLTAIGSAIWCFGLAGIGWAVGSNWRSFDASFRWLEIGVVGLVAAVVLAAVVRGRRGRI